METKDILLIGGIALLAYFMFAKPQNSGASVILI